MIPKFDDYKTKWQVKSDQSIKPGLDSIIHALQLLHNPQKHLKVIHLAGTNGKGSTLTFIEYIARSHGLKVGKFMSPWVLDVHDQIQIDGQSIQTNEMDEIFQQMKERGISGILTDFELLTCIAFLYFKKKNVDLVLLEAGMGGREDSTNVVVPIASVIPSIALEHTNFLGATIESIAFHKAGIIKEETPVIIGELPQEAQNIIKRESYLKNSPLFELDKHFCVQETSVGEIYSNIAEGIRIEGLNRSLLGKHQGANMGLAITAFFEVAKHFQLQIDKRKVQEGVQMAALPGRFEQVLPNVYFDGAHNPASVEKMVETIRQQFPHDQIRFIVGMLADKDVKSVLQILETVSDEFYFLDFPNSRAMPAQEIFQLSTAQNKKILGDGISFIQQSAGQPKKTIVTGSLYLLADLREKLLTS